MASISVIKNFASCPSCGFTTEQDIGTCSKCGDKLILDEETLSAENEFDNGKIFSISSAIFLIMIFFLYNPWSKRHINGFVGLWSSVMFMGGVAGILTGLILMIAKSSNKLLPLIILLLLTVLLVAFDRLILTGYV